MIRDAIWRSGAASAAEVVLDQDSAPSELNRRVELADRSIIIASRIDVRERNTAGNPAGR
jgi:hypothetical protein